jgi:hypothetical protein
VEEDPEADHAYDELREMYKEEEEIGGGYMKCKNR